MRYKNLQNAEQVYKKKYNVLPSLKFYISDNGDYDQAKKTGVIYIDSKTFADGVS